MKWLRSLVLFDQGNIIDSEDWNKIHASYIAAIASIDFPIGSGVLRLRKKVLREDGQWNRNGVSYLRSRFLQDMIARQGWHPEEQVNLKRNREQPPIRLYPSRMEYREPITSDFGGFDFFSTAGNGTRVAIEWETGNISLCQIRRTDPKQQIRDPKPCTQSDP